VLDEQGDSMNQSRLLQSLIDTSINMERSRWGEEDKTMIKHRKIIDKETSKI